MRAFSRNAASPSTTLIAHSGGTARAAIVAAIAAAAALSAPRAAGQTYALHQSNSGVTGKSYGINAYGQVTGVTMTVDGTTSHGFVWQNDLLADVHTTSHLLLNQVYTENYSELYAISDADQAVGTARTKLKCLNETIVVQRAFIIRPAPASDFGTPYPGDALGDLGTFGNPCIVKNSAAVDISNNNHVVGWSDVTGPNLSDSGIIHAFLAIPVNGKWATPDAEGGNANLIDLGTLSIAEGVSAATGVNDAGEAVGYSYTAAIGGADEAYRAFLIIPQDNDSDGYGDAWYADTNADGANDLMQDLGTLGGTNSWARGINNNRQIVGESDTTDLRTHAFLWENGVMTDLGTLGGNYSSASRINEQGHIVGWAETADGKRHAFLYKEGVMIDLNATIPSGSALDLSEARDINAAGEIAGWGVKRGTEDPTTYGFVLTAPSAAGDSDVDATDQGQSQGAGDPATPNPNASGNNDPDLDPLIPTPPTQDTTADTNADSTAASTGTSVGLCGVGGTGALALSLAGLIGMRSRRRV